MEYTQQIRQEARAVLLKQIGDEALVEELITNLIRIETPRVETGGQPEWRNMSMARGGTDGGVSFKPGNLRFNLRDCCRALGEGSLAVSGTAISPFVVFVAVLLMCDSLSRASSIGLTPDEASVAWTIHEVSAECSPVPESQLHGLVNSVRQKYGRPDLSAEQVADALAKLMRIRATEYDPQSTGGVRLCEKINVEL